MLSRNKEDYERIRAQHFDCPCSYTHENHAACQHRTPEKAAKVVQQFRKAVLPALNGWRAELGLGELGAHPLDNKT